VCNGSGGLVPIADLAQTGSPCGNGNVCNAAGVCTCPDLAGPTMVNVGGFCIDSTEVTNAQYLAFLSTNPAPSTSRPCVCRSTRRSCRYRLSTPLATSERKREPAGRQCRLVRRGGLLQLCR